MFVVADIAPFPFVLLASGQLPIVGAAAVVTSTVMVQVVAGFTIWRLVTTIVWASALAVTPPPVHVPPTFGTAATLSPEGKVSVKLNDCVGLVAGWEIVKTNCVVPPTGSAAANALLSVGTAAATVTQAPVVDVPPPAAEFVTAAPKLVRPEKLAVPLVLFACGQTPTVGVFAGVTGTSIVQIALPVMIW
jgi:hypothetical protein